MTISIKHQTEYKAVNTLQAGDCIQYFGLDWILLNPQSGYVLLKENITVLPWNFEDTKDNSYNLLHLDNIGYYLNIQYIKVLAEEEVANISDTYWPDLEARAKFGFLSATEWLHYSKYFNTEAGLLEAPATPFWLGTPTLETMNDVAMGSAVQTNSEVVAARVDTFLGIRPTMYINPQAKVQIQIEKGGNNHE